MLHQRRDNAVPNRRLEIAVRADEKHVSACALAQREGLCRSRDEKLGKRSVQSVGWKHCWRNWRNYGRKL